MAQRHKVLITGANGFVGRHLFQGLLSNPEYEPVAAVRVSSGLAQNTTSVFISDINKNTNWTQALYGVNTVVHTAARVHVMKDVSNDPLDAFRVINVQGTLNLAQQAYVMGVKRFIYISSVKVNGDFTRPEFRFTETVESIPLDAYGISKYEAEQGLREIEKLTGMEVVIIRPPLVYGSGVKANFAALMRAVQRKWVLPLGAIHNKRSLVALDNLVDFIITCINHPQAAGQIFLVSDGHDLSTTELVHGLAKAAGVPARLIPIPVWMLRSAGVMTGKGDAVNRLCGNLQVDISKSKQLLGWTPPISVDEGLLRAIKGMQQS